MAQVERVTSRPRWFVRVSAILVALANLAASFVLSGALGVRPRDATVPEALVVALIVLAAGLLAAEVLLRLPPLRRGLEGGFLARYATLALGIFLGGVAVGILYALWPLLGSSMTLADRAGAAAFVAFFGVLFGGAAGLVEGLVLAFPLAALLGRFRDAG